MKFARTLSVVALAAVVAAGCKDSTGPEDLTVADLIGSWTATELTYISDANSSQQLDAVAIGLATLEINVAVGGAVTGTYTMLLPQTTEIPFAGTISVSDGVVNLTGFPLDPNLNLTVTAWTGGNTITMVDSDQEFNFSILTDPEAAEVAADLRITLVR